MIPLIGITPDIDKGQLKLNQDYVVAVKDAGGLPFIIAPVPSSPLPTGERDRVRGDVVGIADKIDGLLLSGGDDIPPDYYGEALSILPDTLKHVERERVDFEISLLKEMMKRQKPILGICYGMQLVNVALGGSLYQDIGIQVMGAMHHRQGQHKIRLIGSSNSIFNIQYSIFSVNSSHHQAVKRLGKGLEVFALSEDGIIEGFYKRGYPFLVCVQWHPESGLDKPLIPLFKSGAIRGKARGSELEKYQQLSSTIFGSFIDAAKRTK